MAAYTEGKWGNSSALGTSGGTVTYSFALPTSNTYYNFTAQLSAEYQAVVTSALNEWASWADITFVYTSNVEDSDIAVGWGDIDGAGNVLAEAAYSYTFGGLLVWTEIIFDIAELWTPTNATANASNTSFEAVALHELGHTIGLDHYEGALSIMNAYYGGTLELTSYDISAIQGLYGAAQGAAQPAQPAQPSYGWAYGASEDVGGWNYGWHMRGAWQYGWHADFGWDYGSYATSSGSTATGWFYHEGWEYGWHQYGSWQLGWYYDAGGSGIGWNLGAARGGSYGFEDGSAGYQPGGWASDYGWGYGLTIDEGGWNFGWHEYGYWGWGWHYEIGWDYGWYASGGAWDYGWSFRSGWEYGWYQYGWSTYGWYYDYGGAGFGWNTGYDWGGYFGNEYA